MLKYFCFEKTLDFVFWLPLFFCRQKFMDCEFKDDCKSDLCEDASSNDQKLRNAQWSFFFKDLRSTDLISSISSFDKSSSKSAFVEIAFFWASSFFDLILSICFFNDISSLSKIMSFSSWISFFMNFTSSINESDNIDSTYAFLNLSFREWASSFVDKFSSTSLSIEKEKSKSFEQKDLYSTSLVISIKANLKNLNNHLLSFFDMWCPRSRFNFDIDNESLFFKNDECISWPDDNRRIKYKINRQQQRRIH